MIYKLVHDIITIASPERTLEEKIKGFRDLKQITIANDSIKFESFDGDIHHIRGLLFIQIPTELHGKYLPLFTKNPFSPIELVKMDSENDVSEPDTSFDSDASDASNESDESDEDSYW